MLIPTRFDEIRNVDNGMLPMRENEEGTESPIPSLCAHLYLVCASLAKVEVQSMTFETDSSPSAHNAYDVSIVNVRLIHRSKPRGISPCLLPWVTLCLAGYRCHPKPRQRLVKR